MERRAATLESRASAIGVKGVRVRELRREKGRKEERSG
jgi:hypothetical protein